MDSDKYLYLASIYLDVNSPESFGSVQLIWDRVKAEGAPFEIRKRDVSEFLRSFESFTKYQKTIRKIQHSTHVVPSNNLCWESDILHFQKFEGFNDSYKYILCCCDSYSRLLMVEPLKSKKSQDVIDAMESIFKRTNSKPVVMFLDMGTEYTSKIFKEFAKGHNIRLLYAHQDVHAAKIERLQRTLKSIIFRYFAQNNTLTYINHLYQFESNYNHRVHTVTQQRPIDLAKDSESQDDEKRKKLAYLRSNRKFFIQDFRRALADYRTRCLHAKTKSKVGRQTKLKINTPVRLVRLFKNKFQKGYDQNYSDQVYFISQVMPGNPPRYTVRTEDGEEVKGSIYASEMKAVSQMKKVYRDPNEPQRIAVIRSVQDSKDENGQLKYNVELVFEDNTSEIKWITADDLEDM